MLLDIFVTINLKDPWAQGRIPVYAGVKSTRPLRLRLYVALMFSDALCVGLAFVAGALLRFGTLDVFGWPGVTGAILALFTISAVMSGAYSIDVLRSAATGIARALGSLTMAFALLFLLSFFLKADPRFSRVVTTVSFVLASGGIVLSRQFGSDWLKRRFRSRITSEIVLCDGVSFDASEGYHVINAADVGLRPDPSDAAMLILLGNVLEGADRVVIACSRRSVLKWASMLKGANIQGEILAKEFDRLAPTGISSIDGRTTLVVSSGPLNLQQRMNKRLFDLSFAVPALILLLPVLATIAVLIKLDSRGPVLFKQPRVGCGNKLFQILKFRTMHVESGDIHGERSTGRNDQRTTRIGRILRRTSLDELPQLLNVLFGSMSIVGPRPHALGSLAGEQLFWHIDEAYWHRHVLKPGITGLAQVRGFRGSTETREDLTDRLRSDLEYVSGWSLWRDAVIVARTARVLTHPNAY